MKAMERRMASASREVEQELEQKFDLAFGLAPKLTPEQDAMARRLIEGEK